MIPFELTYKEQSIRKMVVYRLEKGHLSAANNASHGNCESIEKSNYKIGTELEIDACEASIDQNYLQYVFAIVTPRNISENPIVTPVRLFQIPTVRVVQ